MKFTIDIYYIFLSTLASLLIAILTPMIYQEVISFALLNLIFYFMYRKKSYYKIPLIFLTGTFFLGVVYRTYTIINSTISYRYYLKHSIDISAIKPALQEAIIGLILIFIGFFIVTYFSKTPTNTYLSINTEKQKHLPNNVWLIIVLLFLLLSVKLFIHIVLGVGLKTIKPTSYLGTLFLLRLIPTELPFIIVTLLVVRYREYLSFGNLLIIIFLGFLSVVAVLSTGSKTFLINFGLSIVVYALYTKFKIRLLIFTLLSIVGLSVVIISFVLAEIVKFDVNKKGVSISEIPKMVVKVYEEVELNDILGTVSTRFSGVDGQILYYDNEIRKLSVNWDELQKSYNPVTICANIFEAIIPGINFTEYPTIGQSIGYNVFSYKPGDIQVFGGALGLFASIKLISNRNALIYNCIYVIWGMFTGLYFRFIPTQPNSDINFILCFFGCFLVLQSTISGNFDLLIGLFLIKVVLLFIYSILIIILRDIVKTKKHKVYYNNLFLE